MRIRRAAVKATEELAQPSDRDCCVFVRNVLRHAYGEMIDAVPIWRWHLIVSQGAGPWEPVGAADLAGVSARITGPALPPQLTRGRWHLCQGWRGVPLGAGVTGHTWLWLDLGDGWGELLDSTGSRGPRLAGLQRWDEYRTQFQGGIAAAELLRP